MLLPILLCIASLSVARWSSCWYICIRIHQFVSRECTDWAIALHRSSFMSLTSGIIIMIISITIIASAVNYGQLFDSFTTLPQAAEQTRVHIYQNIWLWLRPRTHNIDQHTEHAQIALVHARAFAFAKSRRMCTIVSLLSLLPQSHRRPAAAVMTPTQSTTTNTKTDAAAHKHYTTFINPPPAQARQ